MLPVFMQVIAKRTIRQCWERHPKAETPLRVWFSQVSAATWAGPADIRLTFGSADFVGDYRVIFDIGGNKYRLVARVDFAEQLLLIQRILTHEDYSREIF